MWEAVLERMGTHKKIKSSLLLFPVLLVILGILVVVTSSTKQSGGKFDMRNRASTPTGTAEIILSPTTHQYYVGDYFRLDMMLNTGGKAISGAGFRLSYPFTTDVPGIDVLDNNTTATGKQIQSFSATLDPDLITNVNVVTQYPTTNGAVDIDFSAVTSTAEGYSNTSGQKFAQINFLANRVGTYLIQHDTQRSQITDKVTGLDVLKTIDPVTITVATETETPLIALASTIDENGTTTDADVSFSFSASDRPIRQANVFTPLTWTYTFDAQVAGAYIPFAGGSAVISKTLNHGAHTLTISVKDPEGNIATSLRHFSVDATPHITAITPSEGTAGAQILLTGSNLLGTIVKFGTVAVATADYVSRSNTQMIVKVPEGAGNDVKVVNATNTSLVSNSISFTPRTRLGILVQLQGISADKGAKVATKTVVTCGTFTETFTDKSLVWNSASSAYYFNELFPATSVVPNSSTCTISIKETSRLRKKFSGITLAPGITNIITKNTATDMLKVGDFDTNNILELQDYGLLMANFSMTSGLTIPATTGNNKYDLNGDAQISINDIALLLTNLTALQKIGDPE